MLARLKTLLQRELQALLMAPLMTQLIVLSLVLLVVLLRAAALLQATLAIAAHSVIYSGVSSEMGHLSSACIT